MSIRQYRTQTAVGGVFREVVKVTLIIFMQLKGLEEEKENHTNNVFYCVRNSDALFPQMAFRVIVETLFIDVAAPV